MRNNTMKKDTMKRLTCKTIIPFVLIAFLMISGCRKEEVPVIIPEANDVNKFVYNGLKDYYLWNSQVLPLNEIKFTKKDSLNAYLNKFTDPQKLFTGLLYKYKEIDKWSFLVDNSQTIEGAVGARLATFGNSERAMSKSTRQQSQE